MSSIATGAIVVSWAAAIPGREKQMLDVLGTTLAFARSLEHRGLIETTEFYVTKAGRNRDTLMLRGELQELSQLLVSTEFEDIVQEGMTVVQDIEIAMWAGGDPTAIDRGIDSHAEMLRSHGLVPGSGSLDPTNNAGCTG